MLRQLARRIVGRDLNADMELDPAPPAAQERPGALELVAPVRREWGCRQLYPFTAAADAGRLVSECEGQCTVCGEHVRFEGFTDNLRESGFCPHCGSFNRQRQMAYLIRRCLDLPMAGQLALPGDMAVYNTETTGAVHNALSRGASYIGSEFFGPEHAPGDIVDGRRHEDLQRLSFADESLDLVLSSDVLEHMPDPYQAHRELFRVLKPGGRHLFTVPFNAAAARDDVRAKLVDGEIVYLAEKAFHGDPVRPEEGVLVWTIFGMEMLTRLSDIGFDMGVWDAYEPAAGILGHLQLVFQARKPLQPA